MKNAIFDAIEHRDGDTIRRLVQENPAILEFQNIYNNTPLIVACFYKTCISTRVLLECKANPNIPAGHVRLIYPLYVAAVRGNLECTRLLIQHNAIPDVIDTDGTTPLMGSILYKAFNVTKVLIPLSNVHYRDPIGSTALSLICEIPKEGVDLEVVYMLLDRGAKEKERGPEWFEEIRGGRHNAFKTTSLVMTVLKKRCGVSKDMTTMIGKILWETRYSKEWK
jgi:ankyrin repeat protein